MNNKVNKSWTLVAHGQLGDNVYWKTNFRIFDEVRGLLCQLEEIGENAIDLNVLLHDLDDLRPIADMDFPPLYNEDTFEEINGFLVILDDGGEVDEGGPGDTFHDIDIYIHQDDLPRLTIQFEKFAERLRNDPAFIA
jgi:hypothetical protein